MGILRHFLVYILAITLSGCGSVVKITSDPPDAEIHIILSDSKEKKLIGKTPFEIPPEEFTSSIAANAAVGEFFTIEISKTGYKTESYNIPAARFGTLIMELNVKLKEGQTDAEMKTALEIINKLFLAQKFAVSQQYERALLELDQILQQFPTFARALSMKGSIYLARKNYEESLKWYEAALKVDPQMEETVKLSAKVRELMGQRNPAQQR